MAARAALGRARRIVVKVGTRVLVDAAGRPDDDRIAELVGELADLADQGREVILVSSGAIAAGMEALGRSERPEAISALQMCAAVGQTALLRRYARLFGLRRRIIGQVLLTHDGLSFRDRHLRARETLLALIGSGVIPIVNENDAVSVEEIAFGDNDQLAALVALLIDADALVLLTSVNGLQRRTEAGGLERIPELAAVTDKELALAWGRGSALSSGGMASKLRAASSAARGGTLVLIADGSRPGTLARGCAGEDVGTLIGEGREGAALTPRKRWIGYFHKVEGRLTVDAGAREALISGGRSLLPVGITGVDGEFAIGALVELLGPDGTAFARGLVRHSAARIAEIRGLRSEDWPGGLGSEESPEVIHRDNLILTS